MTIYTGGVLVAAICTLLGIFIAKIENVIFRFSSLVIVSAITTYVLYWFPKWLGSSSDQYSTWFGLFFVTWFCFGLIAGLITNYIVRIKKYNGE